MQTPPSIILARNSTNKAKSNLQTHHQYLYEDPTI